MSWAAVVPRTDPTTTSLGWWTPVCTREYATTPARAWRGTATTGNRFPTPAAKANATAQWPEGNDSEVGICTCLAIGTPSPARSGRGRRPTRFTARLTRALVAATEIRPCAAARRPDRPPTSAIAAADVIYSNEWLAACDSPLIPRSSAGVGGQLAPLFRSVVGGGARKSDARRLGRAFQFLRA